MIPVDTMACYILSETLKPCDEYFEGLDHHDKVMLLCNKKFNPADIRPVLQGIM